MYVNYQLPDSSVMSWLGHVDGELAYDICYLLLTWMQKLYKHQLVVTKYGLLLLGQSRECRDAYVSERTHGQTQKFKMEIHFKNVQSNWLYLLWAHLLCAINNPILIEVLQKLNTLTLTKRHIILSILTYVSWWNNIFFCIRSASVAP